MIGGLLLAAVLGVYEAPRAGRAPHLDGIGDDAAWAAAPWYPIDELILGEAPDAADFSGRFKLVWTSEQLFILAEITDDRLVDAHPDPLVAYWEDDALEVFIDEDRSGGDHLYSHNAFAYHIALDGQVVDLAPPPTGHVEGHPRLYNEHVDSVWKRDPTDPSVLVWEVAVRVFPDDIAGASEPVELRAGKVLGFMLAYCDNDGGEQREHFVASQAINPVDGDRNRGYIDADVFGELRLVIRAAPPQPTPGR